MYWWIYQKGLAIPACHLNTSTAAFVYLFSEIYLWIWWIVLSCATYNAHLHDWWFQRHFLILLYCCQSQPKHSQYITLDDGRRLCLECLHTAIMDTNECQPLYIDIQEFYEGMNMKVEQQVPLLLVERQALNEAMEAEKMVSDISIHYHVVYIATSNIILYSRWLGTPPSWNQRSLPIWRTDCQNCKILKHFLVLLNSFPDLVRLKGVYDLI